MVAPLRCPPQQLSLSLSPFLYLPHSLSPNSASLRCPWPFTDRVFDWALETILSPS
ncbi:unnamed protein product [Spirodela intermedia]|uniref:Uncharacterized protein n=1 Tax=Spirodela intermedia TaxID=51605 RepID=A0A7I8KT69_SPIIN|nr:unnamed protein product [Spirodela intermedia]